MKKTNKSSLVAKGFSYLSNFKFKALAFMSFSVLTLVSLSCQKKTSHSEPPISTYLNHPSISVFSNPSNPFDSVGIYHNVFLQQIEILRSLNESMESETLYDSLMNFQMNYFSHLPNQLSWEDAREHFLLTFRDGNEVFYTDMETMMYSWHDRGFLTANELDYLNQAFNLDIEISQDELVSSLLDLEAEISANSGLLQSEKNKLLIAMSTLRHSSNYWETNDDFWTVNYKASNNLFQFASCNRSCRWCVAGADLFGIVAGFIGSGGIPYAGVAVGAFASAWARCCGVCSTCPRWDCRINS